MTTPTCVLGVLLALAVSARPAAAQLTFAAAPTGLLASYAMSNGTDASGNGRTATLTNTQVVPGKYAEALRFTGSNSRMTIPTFNVTTAVTLEAWVFLAAPAAGTVVRPLGTPRGGASGWQAVIYKGLDNFYLAEVGTGFFTAGIKPATGAAVQVVSPSSFPLGVWHHLAAVYDGTALTLYVDAVQVARVTVTGSIAASTQPVEVGGSAIDQGYLTGLIDDVRIYSRALALTELQVDMATPVDTVREDVVSWDLEVLPPAGSLVVASRNFPKTGATCNQAPLTPPPSVVANPSLARLSDPTNAGKECELVIQSFVQTVPAGTGYTMTARARGANTSSAASVASNAFDRVAVVSPPATPGSPTVAK